MKCFLSHNSKDKIIAELIAKELLFNGIDAWLDIWELFPGDSLVESIPKAIEKTEIFILLVSENSNKSIWVKEELRMAVSKKISEMNIRIIPILLDESEVPFFIRDYIHLKWNDGKEHVINSIISAITRTTIKPDTGEPILEENWRVRKYDTEMVFLDRGRTTEIIEKYQGAVFNEGFKYVPINKYYTGELVSIESDFFDIERTELFPKNEVIKFYPKSKIDNNKEYNLTIKTIFNNTYHDPVCFHRISIETYIDELNIRLNYSKTSKIYDSNLVRISGATEKEKFRPKFINNSICDYTIKYPILRNTYQVNFNWIDKAGA